MKRLVLEEPDAEKKEIEKRLQSGGDNRADIRNDICKEKDRRKQEKGKGERINGR